MTLIDFVFPKLPAPKTWSDKCGKSPVSENPSASNMVNELKHCWYLHQCIFILLIDHWKVNWVGKSLCYWHAIFWLFVNTLAADEKYPLLKRDNLTIPIQMQLCQKQKPFSAFLASILKCRWNFENFDKKETLTDFVILRLRTSKS